MGSLASERGLAIGKYLQKGNELSPNFEKNNDSTFNLNKTRRKGVKRDEIKETVRNNEGETSRTNDVTPGKKNKKIQNKIAYLEENKTTSMHRKVHNMGGEGKKIDIQTCP